MTIPSPTDEPTCTCLHCLTGVDERDDECRGCGRSFQGAGRFQRILGRPAAARSLVGGPASIG